MSTIHLSAFIVTLVVAYLIPLVTAFITKVSASTTLKQFVTLVLSAASGFITNATMQDGTAVFTKQALLFAVLSFATANVAYLGTWKPHDINAKTAPRAGLGSSI